jgi:hypothetical protein
MDTMRYMGLHKCFFSDIMVKNQSDILRADWLVRRAINLKNNAPNNPRS